MELVIAAQQSPRKATTVKTGFQEFSVLEGKHLKVETSPSGVEILDAVVPEGKEWAVSVHVTVKETNAE